MSSSASNLVQDVAFREACKRLSKQLAQIGLSLAVYDGERQPLLAFADACEICQRFCGPDGPCCASRMDLVNQVWADGASHVQNSEAGCILLGVPVMQRRRVAGVAIACYLTADSAGKEEFARLCDRLHLDRQYLCSLIDRMPTHSAREAQHLAKSVQWLLAQETENVVAANELATLSTNLGTTYEELSLLYRLSGEMRVNTPPEEFFLSACKDILEVMNIASVMVVLHGRLSNPQQDRIVRAGQLGLTDAQVRALVTDYVIPRLDGEHGVIEHDLPAQTGEQYPGVHDFLAMPLTVGEQRKGMLLAFNKASGEFDSVELKLINSVCNQTAVFLANHHLYEDLQELLMGVLHVLTASIDAKDQYTCGHSQRVALISRRLAEMCGLDAISVQKIYLAGLLHDIGKIGVPESVLCKPGRLTDQEFAIIKRHPVTGANILSKIRQMQEVIPAVLHHHERLDGRGYPDGLSGKDIPMEALMVGLADCFDAMTSSRIYRRALPMETVAAEIMRFSGTQFHPVLVDKLMSLNLDNFMEELRQADSAVAGVSTAILAGAA